MNRADTLRMLALEAQEAACTTPASLAAFYAIHGAELDCLHAMETADAGAMVRGWQLPTVAAY